MHQIARKKIRNNLNGLITVGIFSVLYFIPILQSRIAGYHLYFHVSIFIGVVLVLAYLSLEVYLRFRYPITVHLFTFYRVYHHLFLGFLLYWMSINSIVCMTPHSFLMKTLHVGLTSAGHWGIMWYFLYRYIPRKFYKKNGYEKGIKQKIIEPEKGLYNISVVWSDAVVFPKNRKSESLIEKYPWIYSTFVGSGIGIFHIFEFKQITMYSIGGVFFAIVSMIFSTISAKVMHDHRLIRKWEKENGRILRIK